MMEIIRCGCGYYKQLNDELCPNCKADYSKGDEYEVLDDQDTAYMRWQNLGEKGFNDYMKSIEQPMYMTCPKCRFRMLITETVCPRCGVPVRFKGFNNMNRSLPERFFEHYLNIASWLIFIGIIAGIAIFLILLLVSIL